MKVNDPDARQRSIAIAAYLRAERRNFAPGYDIADWLAAEAEIEREMNRGAKPAAGSGVPAAAPVVTAPKATKLPKPAKATTTGSDVAPKPPAKPRAKRPSAST